MGRSQVLAANNAEKVTGNAGHRQRLKHRFVTGDHSAFAEEPLLELLLTYAMPQRDVRQIAASLLARFGDLSAVLSADPANLAATRGMGEHSATLLKLVDWIRAHRSADEAHRDHHVVSDSQLSFFDLPGMEPIEAYTPSQPLYPRSARRSRAARAQPRPNVVVPDDFTPVVSRLDVPADALAYGFSNGPGSPHSSRTMMLAELRSLLAVSPPAATQEQYRAVVVDDNALLKPTATTRRQTFVRLRELYVLDRRVLLFRALRDLWDDDGEGQPVIALLCAVARDVILRATAETILALPLGTPITWQMLELAVSQHFPDRYNATTLAAMAQHTLSSWRQSGYLGGEANKVRTIPVCRPAVVTYALLLGHLCGARGEGLFDTLWTRLLDTPQHVLHEQARAASQRGWLEYRKAGSVTEITFRHLLREERQAGDRE
jgi:hypothetical protein